MQDQLNTLITRHCDWLGGQVVEISGSLANIEAGGGRDALVRARELVHQVTGSCGTMGFSEISAVAKELEILLVDLQAVASGPDRAECVRLTSLFDRLNALAAEISPEKSMLFGVDLSKIAMR